MIQFIDVIVIEYGQKRHSMLIRPDCLSTLHDRTAQDTKDFMGQEYCDDETMCDITLMDGRIFHACHAQADILATIQALAHNQRMTLPVEDR